MTLTQITPTAQNLFGVMGISEDGDEDDLSDFSTLAEALTFIEDMGEERSWYARVVIYDRTDYNPEYDNVGTISIVAEP